MTNITPVSNNLQKGIRKFVTSLNKADVLLPIVLLEGTVIAGRTYHAHKRGGFVEARERGTEEVIGAIFWLKGFDMVNKFGEKIGKKLFKLDDVNFEVGRDATRNPIRNFIEKISKKDAKLKDIFNFKDISSVEKKLGMFKLINVTASLVIANAFIGFVVPKINQAITRKYQNSVKELDEKAKQEKAVNNSKQEKAKTSFEGANPQAILTLAHSFEHNATYKLIATDAGIAGGRAISARNKHERRECLFRDLSSIYFYMFCRGHINKAMNKIQSGRTTRLDPMSASIFDRHLQTNLNKKEAYSAEEFEKLVFGNTKNEIPETVQSKIKNGKISLDEFKQLTKSPELIKRAEEMSKLQPQIESVSILTAEQVKDLYSNGLIDDAKMLKEVFETHSKKSTSPMHFIAEKDLRDIKGTMTDYAKDIIKKAKATGNNITMETLKKAEKGNLMKSAFNLGAGFAVSAYFLSTAIPKMQYWITQRRTGKNKFPGVETYEK